MGRQGPALWDDPNYVLGTIIPKYKGFDLGAPYAPFNNLYVEELSVKGAASGKTGTFTANGATAVVVSNTSITANSVVLTSMKTVGGTPAGAPYMSAKTVGTSFSMKAAAGDTSVYNYIIMEITE